MSKISLDSIFVQTHNKEIPKIQWGCQGLNLHNPLPTSGLVIQLIQTVTGDVSKWQFDYSAV